MGEIVNNGSGKVSFYGINGKDGFLFKKEKNENGEWSKTQISGIEGNFVKIEEFEYEYEKAKKIGYKIVLQDSDGKYIIETGYSSISRNILNSLAGEEKLGKIMISVYVNKSGFPSVFVTNNGNKTNWKYSIEQQKELTETTTKKDGTKQTDYYDLNMKLKAEIPNINSKADEIEIELAKPSFEQETKAKDDIPF